MTDLPPVLYRGSVKNVRGELNSPNLLFEFSDRYSIFDWGEMPDQLEGKGKTLSIMGKSFFRYLENCDNWKNLFSEKIIKDTFSPEYLKALEESELFRTYSVKGLSHHAIIDDLELDSPFLKVKKIDILKPTFNGKSYGYDSYKTRPTNCLVPLEIIFRLGLANGNSLSKRLGLKLENWQAFGCPEVLLSGKLLKTPLIDFSTKLEKGDRYLDYNEAKSIAALNEAEWAHVQQMANLVALNLFYFHSTLGLELWDGKIELGFIEGSNGNRSFILVDSIGIDELRLLFKRKSFSKEFLRENYHGSMWQKNLDLAKSESITTGLDFKKICLEKYQSSPEPLTEEVKQRAEAVYKSYCNAVTKAVFNKDFFDPEFNLDNYSKRYL
jgi:phosphoribosylaminoimidazole-succinocarboxamide synthase